jgi:FkbM family methyltransferase
MPLYYPSFFRTVLGTCGFAVQIDGRRKELLLDVCDRLFNERVGVGEAFIRVGKSKLQLDLANRSERLLYYAAHNLLRSYRKSPLYSIIARLALPSSLFIDIGANLGLYSFLARSLGYETLLFEPEPTLWAFLSRNREVIGTPVACALSDQCGTSEFFVSGPTNPGSSSLVIPKDGRRSEYERTVPVRLCTFDSSLSELGILTSSIRFIKIDVEGNEEHTLLGMRDYLAEPSSAPIWCEVRGPSSGRNGNSVNAATEILGGFGYVAFSFNGRHFTPYRLGYDPAPQVFDLLYAVPARHGEILNLPA